MSSVISYDVETTSLYPHHGGEVFSYSTCDEEGEIEVRRLDGPKLEQFRSNRKLRALWSDPRSAKTMHNAKFDLTYTEKTLGRRLDDHPIHCTHKMSHILMSNHPHHRLKDLTWELGGYPRDDEAKVKQAASGRDYQKVPRYLMDRYQGRDAERGMLLFLFLYPKIQANSEWLECYDMEMDLVRTTMRMEKRGVMIHPGRCNTLIRDLDKDVRHLKAQLDEVNGGPINPNSDNEIRRLLYRKLHFPVLQRTKKTKQPSVNKDTLAMLHEDHSHPVLDMILKHRSYAKGITTIQSYLDLTDDDDTLHVDINTCKAKTSREATSHPNLQNVQKEGVLLNPFPVAARKVFRPKPGYVNIHLDYSGIEMRLLIHYSGDDRMTVIANTPGGDVHAAAAEIFYGDRFIQATGALWDTLRGAAKNANFAIPYGASWIKMCKTLGLDLKTGRTRFDLYQRTFPKLCNLTRKLSDIVRVQGYIDTAFGRRLYVQKNKPYIGTNYLIQGTAAGVLKRAQNRVHHYLEDATGGEVGIILPIHDEIVIEYPRERLRDLQDILGKIRDLMIDFPVFNVPLEVDAKISTSSWAKATKVDFN